MVGEWEYIAGDVGRCRFSAGLLSGEDCTCQVQVNSRFPIISSAELFYVVQSWVAISQRPTSAGSV